MHSILTNQIADIFQTTWNFLYGTDEGINREYPNHDFATLQFWFYKNYIPLNPVQCNLISLCGNLETEEDFCFNNIVILHTQQQNLSDISTASKLACEPNIKKPSKTAS